MNKNCWISKTRCTEAEQQAVEILAQRDQIDRPDALRTLLREGAKRLGIWDEAKSPIRGSTAIPARTLVDTRGRYEAKVEVEP